ncbi:MAG: DEAD/DEAH box helicase [Pseudomonadota bacterium]|nr:DEAD/DEAH box helicase [Pseudomonadota bacterium]
MWAAGRELGAFLTPDGALQLEWAPPELEIGEETARLQEEVFRRYESGVAVSPPPGVGKRISGAGHIPHAAPPRNADRRHDTGPISAGGAAPATARRPGRGDSLAWLLFLGFSAPSIPLSPSLTFWRTFGALFAKELRLTPDLEELRGRAAVAVPEEELASLALRAPAAAGMEYMTPDILRSFWERLQRTFAKEMETHRGSVAAYIASLSPDAHLAGRVFFHLVENRSAAGPFAFLATYSQRRRGEAKLRHMPLKNALAEYAGNERQLLDLLVTVHEGAKRSALLASLIDTGELFHPLVWSSREAYTFLTEIPIYEDAGIICRIPDWWKRQAAGPRLGVRIGEKTPSHVGMDAILDFRPALLLGDEEITLEEAERLIAAGEAMAFIKNKWVRVDPEKLQEILRAYGQARSLMEKGLTLREAMRLQLQAGREASGAGAGLEIAAVSQGDWLRSVMTRLRNPDLLPACVPDETFRASLRPYQQQGLNWLLLLHSLKFGACLADDMGLGKTVQFLGFLNVLRRGNGNAARVGVGNGDAEGDADLKGTVPGNDAGDDAGNIGGAAEGEAAGGGGDRNGCAAGNDRRASLLVIPASLLGNWAAEIERFCPSLNYEIAHPSVGAAEAAKKSAPGDKTGDNTETEGSVVNAIAAGAAKGAAWGNTKAGSVAVGEVAAAAPDGATMTAGETASPAMQEDAGAFTGRDLVITTYAMVQRDPRIQNYRWRYVILDEAQAIKNPGAKQTRAVKRLQAENRIILTGTPIENRLGDLWSLFDFLNPGLLGNQKEFTNFSKKLPDDPEGYARLRNLVKPYILRRMKTDKAIIADLPAKVEMKDYALFTKRQLVLYRRLIDRLAAALKAGEEGIQRKGLILGTLMKAKQLCNHPDQYTGGSGSFAAEESGKFQLLADICETIHEKRERALIFTQFREMTAPLAAFLQTVFHRPGLVLHGGVPVAKRKGLVDEFQGEAYVPFMVLSLKAGGVGLNLTRANHVIHFDRWWNPAVENQATDRAFRIGQEKNVVVHKFITKGTIEEKIDGMLEDKQRLAGEVIAATGEDWITELDDKALLDLFKPTYKAIGT